MPRSQEPPFSGELTFVVEGPPVSQQSRRSEKDTFAKSIRAQMSECGYLISGDVRIYIEWTLHEQDRYESDAAPDVDNILKPLLDALCGPEGVLIDDCQPAQLADATCRNPARCALPARSQR